MLFLYGLSYLSNFVNSNFPIEKIFDSIDFVRLWNANHSKKHYFVDVALMSGDGVVRSRLLISIA
jgi:hypothetical protein